MLNDDLYIDNDEELAVSTEAAFIPYDIYFRKYGVRRIGHLSTPILTDFSKIVMPRNSVLLYMPEDDADMGISQNHILLRDSTRLLFVDHVHELTTKEGLVKRTFTQPSKLIREYLRKNRKTRVLNNIERLAKDDKILIIENFAMLNHLWQYRPHPLTFFYKWKNTQATLWSKANEVGSTIGRNMYLMVNLPQVIPSISEFRRAEVSTSRMTLDPFHSNETLTLLDIWKWLGDSRKDSVLNMISPEHYDKIHFIFIEAGKWSVINLGLINEWRSTGATDAEETTDASGMSASAMQRRFLRYITTIFESGTMGANTADPIVNSVIKEEVNRVEDNASVVQTNLPDKSDVILSDVKNEELNKQPVSAEQPIVDKRVDLSKLTGKPDKNVLGVNENATNRNKKIELVSTVSTPEIEDGLDQELDSLDHFFKDDPDEIIHETINSLPPLERGIMKKADELAEEGLISAAQYRRIEVLSTKYKELPNPLGEGTFEDLATVSSEDITLPQVIPFADDPAILDKSMLNHLIEDMDKKYNSTVLEKDVASMVLNIQKAGIAVTKYEVEKIEDVLNEYHSYSIRLAPVNGSPSVIRFRLPIIDEDGSYKNNGIVNKIRKQRVDNPIRKVKEGKVALTSYYSKLFVTRSEKVVNNYEKWLFNNIIIKMQEVDSHIQKLVYSNSWNSNYKAPRIYSILAKHFKEFEVNDNFFFFDYAERINKFGEDRVKAHEVDGRAVAGAHSDGLIVATTDDEFVLVTDKEEIDLGNIIDILQIEETKSPIEIAELTVLNKTIPVGVVLSYLLGFNVALKLSKVEYRKVPTGERFSLREDEFVIKFLDETLIFSKRDKVASLLFGGFIKYKDFIKRYGVSTFNKKDIYYNLLDSSGLGLRYLREMGLLMDMWVDPVTESILKDMKEPTEFVGLLFRSIELLLTDWSPDESDLRYQRIRGYERFSGFVYQELIKSVRMYNVQSTAINASIQMHPEAVWREIDKDVSKYLIQESNPLHNLKEKETVTFSGSGGRSAETMTKGSRVYHENDLGVISEASPDNKSVGAIAYLTPNPNFKSLRGLVKDVPFNEIENSSLLSTSALVSPCVDMDD